MGKSPSKTKLKTKSKGEIAVAPPKATQVQTLDQMREHVRDVASMVDKMYISQAIALWKIYQSGIWQSTWGFPTWKEYIKKDVGISEQRDQRLRRLAKVFIDSMGVSVEDLEQIGYSFAIQLLPLTTKFKAISADNVQAWIDYAKHPDCTYRSLELACAEVKVMKNDGTVSKIALVDPPKKPITKKSGKEMTEDDIPDLSAPPNSEGQASEGQVKQTSEWSGEGEAQVHETTTEKIEGGASVDGISLVEPIAKTFKIFPNQLTTVEAALDKCKVKSGHDNDALNLEFICAEFLGTVDFGAGYGTGKEYLDWLVGMMSQIHGVKFSYEDGDPQTEVYEEEASSMPTVSIDDIVSEEDSDPEDWSDGDNPW